MSNEFKVVIPCAGLGGRLGSLSKNVNKALLTLANRPAISYIIEKIPKKIDIIIPLGYKKESLKDFLTLAYPDRKFHFVDVDLYEGPGSGLGYSLLKCKDKLQSPFVFCSNDTIVFEELPEPTFNWMGFADIKDTAQYRSIRIDNNLVSEICSKGAEGEVKPYIGLAGIKDYEKFWEAMEAGRDQGGIEVGESFGLRMLVSEGIKPIKFTWCDTGNPEALEKARGMLNTGDEASANILAKDDEAIWFVNGKVIKFSSDKEFIRNRVERVKHLGPYAPQIVGNADNMYSYKWVKGEIFSKHPTVSNFVFLLECLKDFWLRKKLNAQEEQKFLTSCKEFYRDKTYKRVAQFFSKSELIDTEDVINGERVPKLQTLLDRCDWDLISRGVPVRFHGDLHFENILINEGEKVPFTLLDWRQDFNGTLEYGDIYYDLAKLNHGLIISHELIHRNLYSVNRKLNNIQFDFLRKQSLVDCERQLKEFVIASEYDYTKVETLTALIFLNIAPLHHYPYSLLLFYLGKSMLSRLESSAPKELPRAHTRTAASPSSKMRSEVKR